jgi:hypothetical protein
MPRKCHFYKNQKASITRLWVGVVVIFLPDPI